MAQQEIVINSQQWTQVPLEAGAYTINSPRAGNDDRDQVVLIADNDTGDGAIRVQRQFTLNLPNRTSIYMKAEGTLEDRVTILEQEFAKIDMTNFYTKAESDAKFALKSEITSFLKYKGKVAEQGLLPADNNEIGDVYLVKDDTNAQDTGTFYSWDGTQWVNMGGDLIDLSAYYTKDEADATFAKKTDIPADIGKGGFDFVSDTEPTDTTTGLIWLNTTNGHIYTAKNQAWVDTNADTLAEVAKVYVPLGAEAQISGKHTYTTLPESAIEPTGNNQFATKAYVDKIATGGAVDTSKLVTIDTEQEITAKKTFSGQVLLTQDPTDDTQAVSKKWVEDTIIQQLPQQPDLTPYAKKNEANVFSSENTFDAIINITQDPTNDTNATNKKFVDTSIATAKTELNATIDTNKKYADDNFVTNHLNNEIISGTKIFNALPQAIIGGTALPLTPQNDYDLVTKKYVDENGGGNIPQYTLPIASATQLGGIKVGTGLTIDNSGILNATATSYTLPIATNTTLGGVKIGSGFTTQADGTINVAPQGATSQVDLTAVETDIIPKEADMLNIGSDTNHWAKLHINDIEIDAILNPKTDNVVDLGTADLSFKDGYFKGNVKSDKAPTADNDLVNKAYLDIALQKDSIKSFTIMPIALNTSVAYMGFAIAYVKDELGNFYYGVQYEKAGAQSLVLLRKDTAYPSANATINANLATYKPTADEILVDIRASSIFSTRNLGYLFLSVTRGNTNDFLWSSNSIDNQLTFTWKAGANISEIYFMAYGTGYFQRSGYKITELNGSIVDKTILPPINTRTDTLYPLTLKEQTLKEFFAQKDSGDFIFTQAEYDALTTKEQNKMYVIQG